jgi:hypothetical protein
MRPPILTTQWRSSIFHLTGHTLVKNDAGEYVIAQVSEDGSLTASAIKYVGQTVPDGTPLNLIPQNIKDCTEEICSENQEWAYLLHSSHSCQNENQTDCEIEVRRKLMQSPHRRTATTTKGSVKNLVIPFKFSNHANRPLPTKSDLNILFNGSEQECRDKQSICGNSGSVRTFYSVDSYGQLDLTSVVVDWVQIGMTEAEAAGGKSG